MVRGCGLGDLNATNQNKRTKEQTNKQTKHINRWMGRGKQ
jgi:hypothetical protein